MAAKILPIPFAQPTHTDSNDCPHGYGSDCTICRAIEELGLLFNHPTLTERILRSLEGRRG
ncbi:MAG: hypothetical protein ACRD20_18250 [Terriglobales bacterium]